MKTQLISLEKHNFLPQKKNNQFDNFLIEQKDDFHYDRIPVPSGGYLAVPVGTKILKTYTDDSLGTWLKLEGSNAKDWVMKERGGDGNNYILDKWIPSNTSKFIMLNSVAHFKTPDGKKYHAWFSNKTLETIMDKDPGGLTIDSQKLYDWTQKNGAKPDEWYLQTYVDDKTGESFKWKPAKSDNNEPWWEIAWDWFKKNWDFVAEVIVSIGAGILTAGSSLLIQAVVQGTVALAFCIDDIARGDWWSVGIAAAIASVPIVGRLAKYGTKKPINFIQKYGKDFSKIKTKDGLQGLWEGLDEGEKLLLTRAMKQTPAEMKKRTGEFFRDAIGQLVKEKRIELSKIPFKERLQWKLFFVEGGVQVGTGVGLQIAQFFTELTDLEKKMAKMMINPEKAQEYTNNMDDYRRRADEAEKEKEEW